MYIKFQSNSERITPQDCATPVPEGIASVIKLSGQYAGKATNLMEVTGDERTIRLWMEQNAGKLTELTEAQATTIGKVMSPKDTVKPTPGFGKLGNASTQYQVAGEFDIVSGQTWYPLTYLYAHIAITDADNTIPPGVENDGQDSMRVTITIRAGSSSEAAVVRAVNGLSWRVHLRTSDNVVGDIVKVTFVRGVSSFLYTTTGQPGIYNVSESDLEVFAMGNMYYKVLLLGDTQFKVYRTL